MTDTHLYKGHVLLVMAPMGGGKGTLERAAFAAYPELLFSVSCTTRAPRDGEVDGREYFFISRDEFESRVAVGEFLEWAEFGGNLYGTLKSQLLQPLEAGKLIINEIELQGIEQIKELIPAANRTIVYIDAGDWEVLRARALARGPMSEEELEKRHERYLHEVKAKPHADVVINNADGNLEQATQHFLQVVADCFNKIS